MSCRSELSWARPRFWWLWQPVKCLGVSGLPIAGLPYRYLVPQLPSRIRIPDLIRKKKRREKIATLTAYDATMARILDRAGVDILLVGDSLGTVILGHPSTIPVTLDAM